MAASKDRAQEAWSVVAWGLRNVLAPFSFLRLRNQGNLTQQPSICFRSVRDSHANQACLTEPRPREKQPIHLLSASVHVQWATARRKVLSVLLGPGQMCRPSLCAGPRHWVPWRNRAYLVSAFVP